VVSVVRNIQPQRIVSKRYLARTSLFEKLTMGLVPRRHPKFKYSVMPELLQVAEKTNYQILKFPNPKLRQKNLPVTNFDESLRILAGEMLLMMYTSDGVGLAAPQIGMNIQLITFNEEGVLDKREHEQIMCNPKIINKSNKIISGPEGCLSFPQIYGHIDRYDWIEVQFQDITGNMKTKRFDGFPAIVFQHEYDHLNQVSLIHGVDIQCSNFVCLYGRYC